MLQAEPVLKQKARRDPSLIIDVGMNDGSDTAYYLHCGYRVVAVEANPQLAAEATKKFHIEVASGQLTVLNAGIAERVGQCDFWIGANHQWSSFSKDVATRRGASVQGKPVRVQCLPLSDVLRAYGIPHYLKMDIEGYDFIGLDSLSGDLTPQYISVEFAHGMETKLLEKLCALGYKRFKLLNQVTFTDKRPIFEHELGSRLVRKLYVKASVLRPVVRRFFQRSDFDEFVERNGWEFPEGSSGPFAEQTYGKWVSADEIMRRYNILHRQFQKAGAVFWWDLHATA